MEFSEVIKRRRMIRSFSTEPVPPETADRLLRAANRAPSAGFSQGYAFLVLDGHSQTEPLWRIFDEAPDEDRGVSPGLRRAPLIIVPLSCKDAYLDRYARPDKGWTDRDEARWPVPYWHIDTGFAALLILLAAVDEDLGALFFGIPPECMASFRAAFGVPEEYTPIGAIAVGRPETPEDSGPTGSARTIKRKTLDELVHRGRW